MANGGSGTEGEPLVSVIIPTRNRTEKLRRCISSVMDGDYSKIEVIVVDDASDEPVETVLSHPFPGVRFVRNQKRRFLSCSRNIGARASKGDCLFFLDDDNVVERRAIRALVGSILDSKIAVSAPVIYYLAEPSRVWTSYICESRFPGFYNLHTDTPRGETETFSFHNSFMVKRPVFEELGGFDCANFPIRFSEVDFAHRLHRSGEIAVVNPNAKVWHDLGWALAHVDSSRAYYTERNRMIVIKRYFPKNDFRFYCFCILPFISAYYLLHHPLSSADGRLKTASSLIRGIASGLTFPYPIQVSPTENARRSSNKPGLESPKT